MLPKELRCVGSVSASMRGVCDAAPGQARTRRTAQGSRVNGETAKPREGCPLPRKKAQSLPSACMHAHMTRALLCQAEPTRSRRRWEAARAQGRYRVLPHAECDRVCGAAPADCDPGDLPAGGRQRGCARGAATLHGWAGCNPAAAGMRVWGSEVACLLGGVGLPGVDLRFADGHQYTLASE